MLNWDGILELVVKGLVFGSTSIYLPIIVALSIYYLQQEWNKQAYKKKLLKEIEFNLKRFRGWIDWVEYNEKSLLKKEKVIPRPMLLNVIFKKICDEGLILDLVDAEKDIVIGKISAINEIMKTKSEKFILKFTEEEIDEEKFSTEFRNSLKGLRFIEEKYEETLADYKASI